MAEGSIEIYETEGRTFPPPADFAAAALANDRSLYDEAEADYEAFWARQARELLTWSKDFDTVLEERWLAESLDNRSPVLVVSCQLSVVSVVETAFYRPFAKRRLSQALFHRPTANTADN